MRIGFLNNQIDNRGTGNAMFDYADYNEKILGNESIIYTFPYHTHDSLAVQRYTNRFEEIKHNWDIPFDNVDVLYHIKSGFNDKFDAPFTKYAVHAVFDYEPHGDKYAMVSSWLAEPHKAAFVPHIITLPKTESNLRGFLGILKDEVVFGRYGGADTFDIPFVWDAIASTLNYRAVHFLFMNTDNAPQWAREHPRIHFAEPTADPVQKRMFINTCDAMLHARSRGETFGIACGEFAICGKPIITYRESPEKAHIDQLPYAELYSTVDELIQILRNFEPYFMPGYKNFSPETVMKKFKDVFLEY